MRYYRYILGTLGTFEVSLVHRWYINVSSLYRFQAQKGMLSIVLYMYLFCIKLAIFQIFLAILYKIGIPFLYPYKCTNFVPFFGVGWF